MSDYTSPGYAVAGTLDQILTQRKAEARQAMLDSLNQQNVQSEIRSRDENTQGLTQQRAERAAEYKAQAAKLRMAGIAPGSVSGGDVDFLKENAPSSLTQTGGATLPSTSLIGASELPGGDTSGQGAASVENVPSKPDASIPITSTYAGIPEYQQKKKWQDAVNDLANDPSFNDPAIQKLLKMEAISPDAEKNMPSLLEKLLANRAPKDLPENWVVDSSGHERKLNTPPGAHVINLPAPPRPAAGRGDQYVGTSGGNPVVMLPDGSFVVGHLPPGADGSTPMPIEAKPINAPGGLVKEYGQGEFAAYQKALSMTTPNPQEILTSMNALINSHRDKAVASDTAAIMDTRSPYRKMQPEELTGGSDPVLTGSPEHIKAVLDFLRAIRGF